MAYNDQNQDKRPKSPFDLFQLTKWAPSPTAPGKRAMFSVDVGLDGSVTFTMRTGDPADKDRMKDGDNVRMKLRFEDFEKLVLQFGDAIRSKGECKYAFTEQVRFRWNNEAKRREPLETPRDGIKLFFGKDSAGLFFISLIQYKKTEIEFGFLNDRPDFIFKHGDGTPFSDAENSLLGARSYHKLLTELHNRVLNSAIRQAQIPDQFKPPYQSPNAGGGNGGQGGGQRSGGQGGGNNSGGGNKPAPSFDDMDDDIPY